MNTRKFFQRTIFLMLFISIADMANSQTPASLKLSSSVFEQGKPIPAKYTCESSNVSPPLSWSGHPKNTKSFAIIMDDPDAPMGTWVHWVIYNIPDTVNTLRENYSINEIKAVDGVNSWNQQGYKGPCPPNGIHRYKLKLYTLDTMLDRTQDMTKTKLLDAMKGHILGETVLTGTFN
ncbi:MAG TPA: YbhB/YbcL family Raf kinase inhibitor-like protein [Pedobacter sp.]|jgi:hypothetical protein